MTLNNREHDLSQPRSDYILLKGRNQKRKLHARGSGKSARFELETELCDGTTHQVCLPSPVTPAVIAGFCRTGRLGKPGHKVCILMMRSFRGRRADRLEP